MAATGKTPILLYGSTTASNVPTAGNLTNSSDGCEIAINVADKNLFFKDSTNAVNTVPIRQSSASSNGWLSSTDWTTFNSKQPAGTYVTSVTGTAPVVSSGGTTPAISMAAANGSTNGYLTSTDWTTFNNKAAAFTYTSGYIPYGQGTTTPTQSSNLYFDGTSLSTGTSSNLLSAANRGTLTINGASTSAIAFGSGASLKSYLFNNGTDLTVSGNAGAIKFNTGTDTTKFTISTGGDCTIASGNLVIGTSGKGIDFSATAGTGTSELLADYEEGTWTPALTFGGAAVGMTGTFTGAYTKVGNMVTIWGKIILTAKGSSTGNALITGLPYTKAADPASTSNTIDPITGMAGLTANGAIFSVVSSTVVYPMVQTTTSRVQITDANFTNTSQIIFSSTYKV